MTVGFIGAVTEELPTLVSPAGIATLDVQAGRHRGQPRRRRTERRRRRQRRGGRAGAARARGGGDAGHRERDRRLAFGKIVNGADAEHPDDHLRPHAPRVRPRGADPGHDRHAPGDLARASTARSSRTSVLGEPRDGGAASSADAEILNLPGAAAPDPEVAAIVADAVAKAAVLGKVKSARSPQDITPREADRRHGEPRRRVDARQLRRRRAARRRRPTSGPRSR